LDVEAVLEVEVLACDGFAAAAAAAAARATCDGNVSRSFAGVGVVEACDDEVESCACDTGGVGNGRPGRIAVGLTTVACDTTTCGCACVVDCVTGGVGNGRLGRIAVGLTTVACDTTTCGCACEVDDCDCDCDTGGVGSGLRRICIGGRDCPPGRREAGTCRTGRPSSSATTREPGSSCACV
jgi:hypothetical protein